MIAYHGKPELKKSYINRLEAHRKAEHLVQGETFRSNGEVRGCNLGCLFDYYDHAKGAEESGIPEVLLRLADRLFEGLEAKEADDFAITWPKAIKPGADLGRVQWKFCAFILKENIERVLLLKIDDKLKEQVVDAIQGVLKLHKEAAKTGKFNESAALSAKSAARSAKSAAWSAWSAAESAAESAKSAARSAKSAAWSAWSAAWSAWSAAYTRYAKEFIRLLKEAR